MVSIVICNTMDGQIRVPFYGDRIEVNMLIKQIASQLNIRPEEIAIFNNGEIMEEEGFIRRNQLVDVRKLPPNTIHRKHKEKQNREYVQPPRPRDPDLIDPDFEMDVYSRNRLS